MPLLTLWPDSSGILQPPEPFSGVSNGVSSGFGTLNSIVGLSGVSNGVGNGWATFYGSIFYYDTEIDWIPRWIEANYTRSSGLRILCHELSKKPGKKVVTGANYSLMSFYGWESNPRILYYAPFIRQSDERPPLTYNSGSLTIIPATDQITIVDSFQDLLYETSPVGLYTESGIVFRNLAAVSVNVQSSSGTLNIGSVLNSTPAVPDTQFIVRDFSGNEYLFDKISPEFGENQVLTIGREDYFTVTFQGSALHNALLETQGSVKAGNVLLTLKAQTEENTWDFYAELLGIKRKSLESNVTLKRRCQHMSLSLKPETYVSSALDRSRLQWWDPRTESAVVSSLQGTTLDFWPYKKEDFITEATPTMVASSILLRKVPSGPVSVFHNTNYVDPDRYTVSGSVISFDRDLYKISERSSFLVRYRSDNYVTVTDEEDIPTVQYVTNQGLSEPALLISSAGVCFEQTAFEDVSFRWDQGLLNYPSASVFS